MGIDNSPSNLIQLSFEDHIIAHLLRFIAFRDKRDWAAYNLMRGFSTEGWKSLRQIGAKTTHEILRKKKKHFWDPTFQKKMAKRSMERKDAILIRREGGKKGGRQTQKNKIIRSTDRFLFVHESSIQVCIFNCETGGDVLRELKNIHSGSNPKWTRISPLITNKRKTMYGWSCTRLCK